MEEKVSEECFMTLLDEAVSFLEGDALMERHESVSYSITSGEERRDVDDDISSCHRCGACLMRRVYAEGICGSSASVLFVLPYPEGDTMLSDASFSYYVKWLKAMGLEMKDAALCALIKCPVKAFSRESADACRDYLRNEMKRIKPRVMILLGKDAASYMLRRECDYDAMRLHSYSINGIRTFTTYSPQELVRDSSLRGKIWADLKYIMNHLERGEKTQ